MQLFAMSYANASSEQLNIRILSFCFDYIHLDGSSLLFIKVIGIPDL